MTPDQAIEKYNLRMEAVFVPFRESRNKNEKNKSLNWKVSIFSGSRKILETDYSAGIAHCPAYSKKWPYAYEKNLAIELEVTTGFQSIMKYGTVASTKIPILPDLRSVLHSLVLDGSAIDLGGFENWAAEFGFDIDSRKVFDTYQVCFSIGMNLINAIGISGYKELQEAFADY